MKHPLPLSLYAFLTASVLFVIAMFGLVRTAGFVASKYSYAFATGTDNTFAFFTESSPIVQQAAFERSDVLPIYGSSELNINVLNRAGTFFRTKPTGFIAFPIGKAGTVPLVMAEALANMSSGLAGKKVVVIVSPTWTLWGDGYDHSFAPNSSEQQLDGALFGNTLSLSFKRELARRLLRIPILFRRNPIAYWGASALATDDLPHTALYYALVPLGVIKTAGDRVSDAIQTLDFVSRLSPESLRPPGASPVPDWKQVISHAQSVYAQQSNNNPYGIENTQWSTVYRTRLPVQAKTWPVPKFEAAVRSSPMWGDLDLLLRELRELGARPLILSIPFNGRYYDDMGITATSRQLYYDKLHQVLAPYNFKAFDFQNREYDNYFFLDPNAHLSPVGWGIYDETIDAFYHDRLP